VKPDNTLRQLDELRRFVPAFAHVQLIRVWSGIEVLHRRYRAGTGPERDDRRPALRVRLQRRRLAIGPGVGEGIAELIATGETTTPIEPFSIARFAQKVALPA
jgi:sarcosine oxidase subunit beta